MLKRIFDSLLQESSASYGITPFYLSPSRGDVYAITHPPPRVETGTRFINPRMDGREVEMTEASWYEYRAQGYYVVNRKQRSRLKQNRFRTPEHANPTPHRHKGDGLPKTFQLMLFSTCPRTYVTDEYFVVTEKIQ